MSEGNIPSKDPADEGSLGGAFRSIFRKLLQSVDVMLPARVVSYDRASNTATVRPIIALLTTDGSRVDRASLARVSVLALGGGGFVVNFPLKPGDLGWIEASDRDISLFMQSLNDSQPNTLRMHSFEDARFIPDVVREFDAADAEGMVIQSLDGAVRIEWTAEAIKMRAPTLEGQFDTINFAGVTTFADAVTFQSHTTHDAGAEIGGIEFGDHKHLNVQPGSGTSGGPTA